MILTALILGTLITFNSDLVRVYNFMSNVLFGGAKLAPKETKFN